MATQHEVKSRERIGPILELLYEEWSELPHTVAEIDSWDIGDQLQYIEEWGFNDVCLRDVTRLIEEGYATPQQRQRYEQLLLLVAEYQPLIQQLRDS